MRSFCLNSLGIAMMCAALGQPMQACKGPEKGAERCLTEDQKSLLQEMLGPLRAKAKNAPEGAEREAAIGRVAFGICVVYRGLFLKVQAEDATVQSAFADLLPATMSETERNEKIKGYLQAGLDKLPKCHGPHCWGGECKGRFGPGGHPGPGGGFGPRGHHGPGRGGNPGDGHHKGGRP